ncbi:MAG: acyloxyacyl hydrolase [Lentisphaerae bacterium]|nr:acyloxyacyl hydrolase [Lentisphaerota bacterium]
MKLRKLIYFVLVMAYIMLSAPSFAQDAMSQLSDETSLDKAPDDFNYKIYYKNKLEFSSETGFLPYNIPFIFNKLTRDPWASSPLHYTLVPFILSLRWNLNDISGPWFLRGNTDLTFSGSYTYIPQGPESLYAAFITGVRYNFVQPNWRIVPYLEGRGGLGYTDSKGRDGVICAQGQDFTFTFMLGAGIRYNFNPRYSASVGISYVHISNLYLSEPKVYNYGINVFGPTIGVNVSF